jgi:hypothetical protein
MRGIDYRCPTGRMALVIAKPFINKREAMQGFSRVGRFGDDCLRAKFKDVALVDKKEELKYTGKLIQCSIKLQKKPVALKKISVEALSKSFTNR